MPDEAELVRRTQGGDARAFDQLTRHHLARALRLAQRLTPTHEDAEDVVQEAFVSAWRAIGRFDVSRPFAPWLMRIVANGALSLRRSVMRRPAVELVPELPSPEPSPAVAAERGEVRERFAAALQSLPERQRVIIQLFEVDGFSSTEIAQQLELSDSTVRWHVHSARRVLRRALAPFAGESGGTHE